jgi:catechol 2,3-dioxygenase
MSGSTTPTAASIDARTSVGAVALTVSDLDRSVGFYETVLGLSVAPCADGSLALRAGARGPILLTLREDRDAAPFDARGNGLFHFALLVPTRFDLARALARIARARWPLSGASDHLVSEALYLGDPDGNGIEIYRDRPRAEWAHDQRGAIQMATLALDLDDVLDELDRAGGSLAGAGESSISPGTQMGHIHLQVSDLDRRAVLLRRARLRCNGPHVLRGAVRLSRRLPPPHRAQHLAESRRRAVGSRCPGPSLVHGVPA